MAYYFFFSRRFWFKSYVIQKNHAKKWPNIYFFPTILGQGAPSFRNHVRQKTVYLHRSMRVRKIIGGFKGATYPVITRDQSITQLAKKGEFRRNLSSISQLECDLILLDYTCVGHEIIDWLALPFPVNPCVWVRGTELLAHWTLTNS